MKSRFVDAETLMLVRLAALVSVDAPPISYVLNMELAGVTDVSGEDVQGMLAAIAPIVGSARVGGAHIPQPRRPIMASRRQPVAVVAERQGKDI